MHQKGQGGQWCTRRGKEGRGGLCSSLANDLSLSSRLLLVVQPQLLTIYTSMLLAREQFFFCFCAAPCILTVLFLASLIHFINLVFLQEL